MTPRLWLNLTGAILVLSGLIHVVVWMISGGLWEGDVSWRKPILFGLSTGATVLSVAWLYPKLAEQRYDVWLIPIFSLAMLVEVALITGQQWRGVASHFNHETPIDAWIENALTGLIALATLVLLDLTRRALLRVTAPEDLQWAIRGGMVFLILSCAIGFGILVYGNLQMRSGGDPTRIGQAGVAKFPHGVAIHAIQIFPGCCWLAAQVGIPLRRRKRLVVYLIAAMTAFMIYSLIQTLGGRARFDLTTCSSLVLASSLFCLVMVAWPLLRSSWHLLAVKFFQNPDKINGN